jgi:prevent-host-death family protein
MMKEVGVYEAKTQLPRLLNEVENGETVLITRHGRPVARLIPATDERKMNIDELVAAIRENRKGNRLNGVTIRELIEEGRE